MANINKLRVIKNYEKLTDDELEQIKLIYPRGFRKHLVEFTGIDGKKRKGLPIETEEKYYLIRMTQDEAIYVIANDDDYDDNGRLKPGVQSRLADKHDDEDFLDEYNSNDDNDYGDDDFDEKDFSDEEGDISIDDMDNDVEDEGSDRSDDIDL